MVILAGPVVNFSVEAETPGEKMCVSLSSTPRCACTSNPTARCYGGPMWQLRRTNVDSETECWHLLAADGTALSFGGVCSLWTVSQGFRAFWAVCLHEVPFDSYCWECPPVTSRTLAHAFECVFVESPLLAGSPPDEDSFAGHFRADRKVVSFESLGKDALLVVPCPGEPSSDFAHLSRFMITATEAHISALWQAVGNAMEARVGEKPVWLSTAGLGVSWLHIRLDSRPKYYRHAPYKSPSARSERGPN